MKKYKVKIVKEIELEAEFDGNYWDAERTLMCALENDFEEESTLRCIAEKVAKAVLETFDALDDEAVAPIPVPGAVLLIKNLSCEVETDEY